MVLYLQRYYARKIYVISNIAYSNRSSRHNFIPVLDLKLSNEYMESIALKPYIFQGFPGGKLSSWPESLHDLNKRIHDTPQLSLWNEPFDEDNRTF
jgi:hypothetical protein